MTAIKLTGWHPGLRKISLTKLLQGELGISVATAKAAVDDLLDGREVLLQVPDQADTHRLVTEIRELGATCQLD